MVTVASVAFRSLEGAVALVLSSAFSANPLFYSAPPKLTLQFCFLHFFNILQRTKTCPNLKLIRFWGEDFFAFIVEDLVALIRPYGKVDFDAFFDAVWPKIV